MKSYATAEEATAAVESLFGDKASEAFMTATHAPRFLVTRGMDGYLVVALGGGGIYQRGMMDEDGEEVVQSHHAVAKVSGAFVLPLDVASALAQSIIQHLQPREAGNGE